MTAASIIHSGHAACFICLLLFTSGTCSAGWLSRLAGDKEAEWRAARDSWCGKAVAEARRSMSRGEDSLSRIDATIRLADLERMQGRIKAAEALTGKALELSLESLKGIEKDLQPRLRKLTTVYYALGCLHRSQRNYHKAEKAFSDAKKAGQLVLKPEDPVAARAAAALASVMSTRGDLEQGRRLCIWAADTVITHCGSNDVEIAWIDEMMGFKFAGVERYEDALLVYNHMLEVREAALPPEHPDLADAHNRVASLLFELGRREHAITHLEKALGIRIQASARSIR